MENSKKIVLGLLFFYGLGCIKQKCIIKNPTILFRDKQGQLMFRVSYYKNGYLDTVYITKVKNDNSEADIEDIIDPETFDLLYKFKKDSLKINNLYEIVNPCNCYYRDKKHIYFFQETPHPVLINMASLIDYEVLGGAYLKVNNKIYWAAQEVKQADINTFHTGNIQGNNTEWEWTVGFDKNNIYSGAIVMTQKRFESGHYLWQDEDSLRKKYFSY